MMENEEIWLCIVAIYFALLGLLMICLLIEWSYAYSHRSSNKTSDVRKIIIYGYIAACICYIICVFGHAVNAMDYLINYDKYTNDSKLESLLFDQPKQLPIVLVISSIAYHLAHNITYIFIICKLYYLLVGSVFQYSTITYKLLAVLIMFSNIILISLCITNEFAPKTDTSGLVLSIGRVCWVMFDLCLYWFLAYLFVSKLFQVTLFMMSKTLQLSNDKNSKYSTNTNNNSNEEEVKLIFAKFIQKVALLILIVVSNMMVLCVLYQMINDEILFVSIFYGFDSLINTVCLTLFWKFEHETYIKYCCLCHGIVEKMAKKIMFANSNN